MNAEKGWIGEPQPEKEWHTPGWLARERHRPQPLPQSSANREAAEAGAWARP